MHIREQNADFAVGVVGDTTVEKRQWTEVL